MGGYVLTAAGRRVIVDPAETAARIYNWFYLFINLGALVGQLSMVGFPRITNMIERCLLLYHRSMLSDTSDFGLPI